MVIDKSPQRFETITEAWEADGAYERLQVAAVEAAQWLEQHWGDALGRAGDTDRVNNATSLWLRCASLMVDKANEVAALRARVGELEKDQAT